MRLIFAIAASVLLLAGCTVTPPSVSSMPAGSWRVVPLSSTTARPDRSAILVNQQTGDTWVYDAGSNQWTPVERK